MLDITQAIVYITSMKTKNRHAVALGRLGGKAGTGKAKARTSEQARAAVMVRWREYALQKQSSTQNSLQK